MRRLLYEFTAVVEVAPEAARERLRAGLPGWADEGDGLFSIEGGWWYRGEYQVTPQPPGTRITHRVFNIAKVGRWAVPMANRFFIGFEKQTRARFTEGLKGIISGTVGQGTLGADGLPIH